MANSEPTFKSLGPASDDENRLLVAVIHQIAQKDLSVLAIVYRQPRYFRAEPNQLP